MRAAREGWRVWRSEPWVISARAPLSVLGNLQLESSGRTVSRRVFHVDGVRADDTPADSSPPVETSSPAVRKIHQELIETMKGHCIPRSALVSSLLQQCSTPGDIELALDAIARLRITKAVQGQQQANFGPHISKLVVNACLRANDPENALKTLRTHNIYGFTPSLEPAHQILAHARVKRDVSLMQKTLKAMSINSVSPTRNTAEIALRICKYHGDENLLFSLAKEFHGKGLKFRLGLYDLCIATAANAGARKHVMEINNWRSQHKLPSTIASTFALAKAHLLKGKPKDAAQLIHSEVKYSEERDMYLRVLVRAWPAEVLPRHKRSMKEETLRASIEAMLDELQALGARMVTDAALKLGTGKETLRRVVYS